MKNGAITLVSKINKIKITPITLPPDDHPKLALLMNMYEFKELSL